MNTEPNKNDPLWRIAKKRVAFRWTLLSYLATSIILTAVWFLSGRGSFWPAWVMIFWGIALVVQYIQMFHVNSIEEEYKKLQDKQARDKEK